MSYRDTFRMLVSYVSTLISIAIDNLKISDITTDVITKFLIIWKLREKFPYLKKQSFSCNKGFRKVSGVEIS